MISGLSQLIVNYIKTIDEEKYTRAQITISIVRKGSFIHWKLDTFDYLGRPMESLTNCCDAEAIFFNDSGSKYTNAMLINSTDQYTFIMNVSKNKDLRSKMNISSTTIETAVIGKLHLPEASFWSNVSTYSY